MYPENCTYSQIVEINNKMKEIDLVNHCELVNKFCKKVAIDLIKRGDRHDVSKIGEEEFDLFKEFTPLLKGLTYGSPEYIATMEKLRPAIEHHYKANRHHPEFFPDKIKGMNLIDIIEMFCDWYSATKRHADGDIFRSIEINQKRFGYSDDFKQILLNTVEFLQEAEKEN